MKSKKTTKRLPEDRNKEANLEFLERRKKSLRDHKAAVSALTDMGISLNIQKDFFLGLSGSYTDRDGNLHKDALVAPVINDRGNPLKYSVYCSIPNVTVNPGSDGFWANGEARSYFSEARTNQTDLVICHNILDLWLLYELCDPSKTKNGQDRLLFAASTDENTFPREWQNEDTWAGFDNIFLAYPNNLEGDDQALAVSAFIGRPTKRIILPGHFKDWRIFCRSPESNYEQFKKLLENAKPTAAQIKLEADDETGRVAYTPIDVPGSVYNGYLYYPTKTLLKTKEKYRDEEGKHLTQTFFRTEVVLIRSDRTIQEVFDLPAPRGTPLDERVLRISDGTIIESRPKASVHASWSWTSIDKYLKGTSKTRKLGSILTDIKDFLSRSVWLPFSADYDLLTLLVPVTFAQAVFNAVPLVLVTGPAGTGKSALGKAMASVCANGITVGQISVAAIARLIDETKGFVVFDDLEAIGKRKGREAPQFSELVQALKLSYNRETAVRTWTDVSRGMSLKKLNFFGVKMFNNTSGSDNILGSRTLKIHTRRMPASMNRNFDTSEVWDPVKLSRLRDELHTWTFENVKLIEMTYQRLIGTATDRTDEITAPLRAIAEIAGINDLKTGLETALEFQNRTVDEEIDLTKYFLQAVKRIILGGYRVISSIHVILEMKVLLSGNPAADFEALNLDNTTIIGRQLRTFEVVEKNAPFERQFLHGKYLRIYPIRQEYLDKVLSGSLQNDEIVSRSPFEFCRECETCEFQNFDCAIMRSRYEMQ